jgi:hypothetical protein
MKKKQISSELISSVIIRGDVAVAAVGQVATKRHVVVPKRSPAECGVSECDREASIMRRPWPTGGCCSMGKN